jgi:hypothetical protein
LVHGLAHILTPLVLARLFAVHAWTVVASYAVMIAVVLSLRLARPAFRSARRGAALAVAGIAFAVLVCALGAIIAVADGRTFAGATWWKEALWYGAASLAAMPLGTVWFTWYLAVAGKLHGHNNEVGGTARVTKYRQLIRFHVHKAGLTGYVIAAESDDGSPAKCQGTNLVFRLIDVFTIPADGVPAVPQQGTPAQI